MSKVSVYGADCCGKIVPESKAFGVAPALDMFDLNKLATTKKPEDSSIHYCLDCYRSQVLNPAAAEHKRAQDEDGYNDAVKTYSNLLKRKAVKNYQGKKWFAGGKPTRDNKNWQ